MTIKGSLEEGCKHPSVHYFPTLRIHSNDIMIKHFSESPSSKFQERFACHISIVVRGGRSGGALQGNRWLQKAL